MSKNIDKIKTVGFDEISELYFNYDWEKGNSMQTKLKNIFMTSEGTLYEYSGYKFFVRKCFHSFYAYPGIIS